MVGWAADILSLAESPNSGYLRRYLASGQMPAHSRFCRLSYLDLNSINGLQIFGAHTVAVGNIFEDVPVREVQRFPEYTPLS